MKKPTVSVIVPVYNAEKTLHRCVDSILAQSYKDFEILLINDGATDGSGVICDNYAACDPRIHTIHKINGGVSSARNLGLDNATGDYISFIDSDDYVNPSFLESFTYLDSLPDICFQGLVFLQPQKESVLCLENSAYSDSVEDTLLQVYTKRLFGWGCNKLFKRSIIQEHQVRFDPNLCLREDELFTLEFCQYAKTISISDKADYIYEIHDLSLMSKPKDPSLYTKINDQLHRSASYFTNAKLKQFEEAKYTAETINAIKWMYSSGIMPEYNRDKRCEIIRTFVGNRNALHSIVLFYKNIMLRWVYCFLWFIKLPRLIDIFFQLRYKTKYTF